ncbi:sigma-54 interaction domain-containing protein [Oxalicibacterium faecigallinarum]|uniref:Nif-specific regulatory protein n=1 Tax=Oxalicibacterium faecigallinarum TaxID=573741 RepID=A0A8J3AUZ7_9BURK|nr:sigma 54-interacting transcriptional regulator [Oxalicibacterium faecigallinarum]GGI19372.1 Nif-specific regulatory protein [Oxalicibacterium faecigallinarum]
MSVPAKSRPTSPVRSEPSWREQERVLLGEVMRLVGQSLAPEVVFKEMLHLLSELLGLNRGRIVLIDGIEKLGSQTRLPSNPSSSIRYAYGLTPEEAARGRYAHGEGITGTVLATGQAAVIQNIDAEPLFLARAVERARLPQEIVAYIAIPIEMNRRVVGVLGVHRIRRRKALLSDDLALLKMLATLAGQLLQLQSLVEEKTRELEARNLMLSRALDSAAARYGIIGSSPALLRALDELERVSQATASVLLLGESGTGKELFARALHMASPRRDAPFIKVNCAAIPDTLFESELFGHERGAFTGAATSRAGWFEQADGGTIFLDEIGEMPLAMQTKLLRTLQEGTIVRLGGKREVPIDVRLVAATNRDLAVEVERGSFRRDLFYRLNVIPIHLPSLAERRDDIRALALHFLNRNNQANQRNVHLSTEALDVLAEQSWPGNIRELSNVIERLVLLTDQSLVTAEEVQRLLPRAVMPLPAIAAVAESEVPLVREYLQHTSHEAETLRQAMARHGGNQSRAAQSLGLTPRQFGYRWRKLHPDT